jgi:hypothetical protein
MSGVDEKMCRRLGRGHPQATNKGKLKRLRKGEGAVKWRGVRKGGSR